MSGSNVIAVCPNCKASKTLRGKAFTIALTCDNCNAYYVRGEWRNNETTNFNLSHDPVLPVGAIGRIDDTPYEVMGFVVKKEQRYKYTWREYLLFNPFKGYAFLSEYDGHWNFIWPIEDSQPPHEHQYEFTLAGTTYALYQTYRAEVIFAQGEFFFDVIETTDAAKNSEYIAPPFLYGVESSEDSLTCFQGEYMTPKEVAAAFTLDVTKLPSKTGVGYTQPMTSAFSQASLIKMTLILIVVALVIQLFFNSMSAEKQVFQGKFLKGELTDQKFFKTESFTLEGGSKSVEIDIWAPVANDWFFGEFSLINETDGTEYTFTKSIEFYSGTEDGYAWSEGSTYGEAFLSAVPGGRYHVNIYPEFSEGNNHEFTVRVIRDVPTNMNFFIVAIAVGLGCMVVAIRRRIFEGRRWKDSEYSPYQT
jgi:Domain of unknown function (DUF4178)